MTRFLAKDRKLYMHAAHRFVGVSRMAQSQPPERGRTAPLTIDVFANRGEQGCCRRLIDGMMAYYPADNWLMQAHLDPRHGGRSPLDECDCAVILGGSELFSPALLAEFENYAQRGGALVVLHAGGQTSPAWKEFSCKTLGVCFEDATPAAEKMTLRIAAGRHFHPLVQEVAAWEIESPPTAVLDWRAELFWKGFGTINNAR